MVATCLGCARPVVVRMRHAYHDEQHNMRQMFELAAGEHKHCNQAGGLHFEVIVIDEEPSALLKVANIRSFDDKPIIPESLIIKPK